MQGRLKFLYWFVFLWTLSVAIFTSIGLLAVVFAGSGLNLENIVVVPIALFSAFSGSNISKLKTGILQNEKEVSNQKAKIITQLTLAMVIFYSGITIYWAIYDPEYSIIEKSLFVLIGPAIGSSAYFLQQEVNNHFQES